VDFSSYNTHGPPSLRLHEVAGWTRLDCRRGQPLGRTTVRSSLCRRNLAETSLGLQAVLSYNFLPVANLDGEDLCPLVHHLVRAVIWGRQQLLMGKATLARRNFQEKF
jgi:hypothetical protein